MIDRFLAAAVALTIGLSAGTPAQTQTKCDTVLKCAQTAVEAATAADAAAKALQDRVAKVEALVARLDAQLTGPNFYRCPEMLPSHSGGSLGGGAWGFYGCQGQVTTQSTCTVIEYPKNQSYACTSIGRLRILPP
jgi:hypothetical protein